MAEVCRQVDFLQIDDLGREPRQIETDAIMQLDLVLTRATVDLHEVVALGHG